jgi:hypothetical protein
MWSALASWFIVQGAKALLAVLVGDGTMVSKAA